MFDIDRRPANKEVAKILKKGFEFSPDIKFCQTPRDRPLTEMIYQGPKEHDIRGLRFGRLVVVGYVGKHKGKDCAKWDCRCDCGNYQIRIAKYLKRTQNKFGEPHVPKCEYCHYIESLKWKGSNEQPVQDIQTDQKRDRVRKVPF